MVWLFKNFVTVHWRHINYWEDGNDFWKGGSQLKENGHCVFKYMLSEVNHLFIFVTCHPIYQLSLSAVYSPTKLNILKITFTKKQLDFDASEDQWEIEKGNQFTISWHSKDMKSSLERGINSANWAREEIADSVLSCLGTKRTSAIPSFPMTNAFCKIS